jgi:hypothetical protein
MIVLGWLLGLATLAVLGWWLVRAFSRASPKVVAGSLKLFLASFAAMAGMGLLTLGRLGLLLALVGAVGLTFARMRAQWRPPDPIAGDDPAADGESAIETDWLSMRLDRATGTMSGRVLRGDFAARELASLDLGELLALRGALAAAEPGSLPLIDTWLDRCAPGWRTDARSDRPSGRDATSAVPEMDEAAALEILGLHRGAGRAEIEAAYRRVMSRVHPDSGGSDRLASLVNAARDFLSKQR